MPTHLETLQHEWQGIEREGSVALKRDLFDDPAFCRDFSERLIFAANAASYLQDELRFCKPELMLHLPVLESMFASFRRELDEGRGRNASGYLGLIGGNLIRLGLVPAQTT